MNEPHIDEFAVNFPCRTSCCESLPACILHVLASCINSNHKRLAIAMYVTCNDIDLEELETVRMETTVRSGGLECVMKTGRVLQAFSCPACRAHHGVQHAYAGLTITSGHRTISG